MFGDESDITIVRILWFSSIRGIWYNDSSSDHVQAHLGNRVEAKLCLSSLDVLSVCHLHLNDLVDLLHLHLRL